MPYSFITPGDRWREANDRFVALLENPNSLEREWECLFTEFPFILSECLSLGIEPERLIPCTPGRPEADFYFYPQAHDPLSPYGVIEIKRPKTRILSEPRNDVFCLSPDLNTAVAQARKYAMDLDAKIAKPSSDLIILGNPLHMFVIAGLRAEFAAKVKTALHRSQVEGLLPHGCRLVPFDMLCESVASRVPPRVYVMTPWYPGMARPPRDFGRFEPRRLYAVNCSDCGQEAELPFKPTEGKPVYCRDCYSKRRRF